MHICMDVMVPEIEGQQALKTIRSQAESQGIEYPDGARVIVTTALDDTKHVLDPFDLMFEMEKLGLIEPSLEGACGSVGGAVTLRATR